MTATSKELNFETALQNVITELKAPKTQTNTFGRYNFRNAEDIVEAVKPLLKANGLRMKLSDEIVYIEGRFYVKSTVTVKGYGEEDTAVAFAREELEKKGMDGAQVTGASSSYARKYALNGMFNVDDTKDADSDDNSQSGKSAPATEKQKDLIRKLAREIGTPEESIEARLKEITTSAQASDAISKLKG